MVKKRRGRPPKNKVVTQPSAQGKVSSKLDSLSKIDISESYVSLTIGIVVVIFAAVLVLVFLKQRNSFTQPRQEISSQKIEEIDKTIKDGQTYTVVEGDDLKAISRKFYGTDEYYLDIAKASNLENADVIEVGMKLKIPALPTKSATSSAQITGKTYVVQQDEYLWDIAVKVYGDGFRWVDLAKANNMQTPDILPAGTVLQIPQ